MNICKVCYNYPMKTIKDIDVKNKTILMRVDYNVPLKDGQISDDLRIRASLPTINYLLDHGAKRIILISHLGRPKGQENTDYTLSPVADSLRQLLPKQKIGFYPLPQPGKTIPIPSNVNIVLLENLRFDPGEEANSSDFIGNIVHATNPDFYVQDDLPSSTVLTPPPTPSSTTSPSTPVYYWKTKSTTFPPYSSIQPAQFFSLSAAPKSRTSSPSSINS